MPRSSVGGVEPGRDPPARRRHPFATTVFWLGIAISAIFGFLALREANLSEVWDALRGMSYGWLAPALLVFAAGIFLRAVRWQLLFHRSTRPPLGAATSAMLIGYLFNNILPLRAGEAARIVTLKQRAGVSRSESAATVVLERAYDVLTLVLLLLVLSPWLPDVGWLRAAAVVAVLLAACLAAGAIALIVWGVRPLRFALRPLSLLPFLDDGRLAVGAESLGRGLAALRSVRLALTTIALALLSWLVLGLSYWLVMLGFDLELSPLAGVLVTIALGAGMMLPSSPAAVGVFEAATIVALAAYDVDGSEALSYALVLHAFNFVPFLVVGLAVLHRHGADLRRRGAQPERDR